MRRDNLAWSARLDKLLQSDCGCEDKLDWNSSTSFSNLWSSQCNYDWLSFFLHMAIISIIMLGMKHATVYTSEHANANLSLLKCLYLTKVILMSIKFCSITHYIDSVSNYKMGNWQQKTRVKSKICANDITLARNTIAGLANLAAKQLNINIYDEISNINNHNVISFCKSKWASHRGHCSNFGSII